jgi:hypothetical protein
MYSPDSAQPARSDAAWFYYISNQTQVNGAGPQLKYAAGTLNYWENITGVMTGVMPTGPASGTFNLNVNFYTPNTIVSALYAYAYVSGGELSLYEQGTNYTVSNDAATIQILGVFDASGNPISNYTLTTGSDYNYASVPLPPSLLLFGPGLVGLAAVRRRFKK